MSDRCEPPEELRGVDGWHWVEAPAIQMCFVLRWWRARGQWCWADMDERTLRSFRYLAPVATPAEVEALRARVERLEAACSKTNDEVCQKLGKVLNYPWLMDDQANFPGATEVDGVCVGDHVAESIAAEAAAQIDKLRVEASEWCQSVQLLQDRVHRQKGERDALAIAFQKLSAVLRVNMLRHVPDTSHAEIDAAIDACLGPVARAALEDRP